MAGWDEYLQELHIHERAGLPFKAEHRDKAPPTSEEVKKAYWLLTRAQHDADPDLVVPLVLQWVIADYIEAGDLARAREESVESIKESVARLRDA